MSNTIRVFAKSNLPAVAGVLLLFNIANAQNWVPGGPVVPLEAIQGGREAPIIRGIPGKPIYVCRGGRAEGYGLQVGRYETGSAGCEFGFGGKEVTVPDFEFLVSSWQAASLGAVPANAVVAGFEAPVPPSTSGQNLYFCRAHVSGPDWQLGKIRPGFGACFIPHGGKEFAATSYEVLVHLSPAMPLIQVNASSGTMPFDAIRSGTDNDGLPLYLCTVPFAGGMHPGKLKSSFLGCDISYGGTEHIISSYNVLVANWLNMPPVVVADWDFPAGTDIDGSALHVCRAYVGGAIYPGKTRESWITCNFGLGGKEQTAANYDLLSAWRPIP